MMTSYVFMWENPSGERRWEAVTKEQINGFLKKLIDDGVHPATVIVAYAPMLFHWVWQEYHNGWSDVDFHCINEEIYGTEFVKSKHEPVDVPIKKEEPPPKYGWIAPDGRFFGCDYGGHISLATKIVGEVRCIFDPEQYLEELGWAKIMSGSPFETQYAVDMGVHQKLTDAQLKVLTDMDLENAYGISRLL